MKILSKFRYIVFLFFILLLATITAPFIIFFNWNGIWLLYIANEEGCSLSDAKQIFIKGNKYKFSKDVSSIGCNKNSASSFLFDYDQMYTAAYKNLPSNIHHKQ